MDEAKEVEREGLGRVAEGLRLVAFGLATTVALTVAIVAVSAMFAEQGKDGQAILISLNQDHPEVVMGLIGLNVLAIVLGTAGKAFCLGVPPAAGATAFIVMALACDVIGLVTMIVARVSEAAGAELWPLMAMAWMFGYFAFLRFLRRVSEYLGAPRLVARARRLQVVSAALIFATIMAALALNGGGGEFQATAVGLLLLVCVPCGFVMFARLVVELRREARAAAEGLGETY